jgi:hypothetical protein
MNQILHFVQDDVLSFGAQKKAHVILRKRLSLDLSAQATEGSARLGLGS